MGRISKILLVVAVLLAGVFLIFQPIYNASAAGLVPCGGDGEPACTKCHIFELASRVINFILFTVTPAVAVLLFLIAGFMILLGGASPGTVSTGRNIFKTTVWGLLMIFAAWMITNTILKSLAGEKPFAKNWNEITCGEAKGGPGTSLTANGSTNITVGPNVNIKYEWSSTNAISGSATLQIKDSAGNDVAHDPCSPANVSGTFPFITGISGTISFDTGSCQIGYTYIITYVAVGSGGSGQAIVTIKVGSSSSASACSLEPLAPITDSAALAMEGGQTVVWTSSDANVQQNLTKLQQEFNKLQNLMVTQVGGSATVNSVYRPYAYQFHLFDIYMASQVYNGNQAFYDSQPACSSVVAALKAEQQKHGICGPSNPCLVAAPNNCAPHVKGTGIDISISPESFLTIINTFLGANSVDLRWQALANDPVHFNLQNPPFSGCAS